MTLQRGLYAAWKGASRDQGIYWSRLDGDRWTSEQPVSGARTDSGPALSQDYLGLVLAWRGVGVDDNIYISRFDGSQWVPPQRLNGAASSDGPALDPFDGISPSLNLAAWKGRGNDDSVYCCYYRPDEPDKTTPAGIGGAFTSTTPAVGDSEGVNYLAWKGAGADESIYWTRRGMDWDPPRRVGGVSTSSGPTLSYADFGVGRAGTYMAWKGRGADEGIYWSHFDGTTDWTPQQPLGVSTSTGPALAKDFQASPAFAGLFMMWTGMSGDQRLYWSHFDGNQWTPQRPVGAGSSSRPALIWYQA